MQSRTTSIFFRGLFVFLFFSSPLLSMDNDDVEDRGLRTFIKATIVPKAAQKGEEFGTGIGFTAAKWIVEGIFTPKKGSVSRWIFFKGGSGNTLDEWGPMGQKIVGYICSIGLATIAMVTVDRYYSPWRRFCSCIWEGDTSFNRLKKKDSWKLFESTFLGVGIGGFVIWDLRNR